MTRILIAALPTAAILLIGLAAALPFATSRAVGGSESYNYSMALADGVLQMRAGVFPPLVGQTEFAFNGRVHPLRNAPYLFYLAGALDLLTGRQLSFWGLQNLSLCLSLIAAAFVCNAALRWSVACPWPLALVLTAAYVLSPALLASAYGIDLYMTVHAAPFIPAVIGLCLRQLRDPRPANDLNLAAALAAAWLAHPPVAAWLTLVAAVLRALAFLRRPSWSSAGWLLVSFAAGAVLSAFVFASVASLNRSFGMTGGTAGDRAAIVGAIRQMESGALPASLLPVSGRADLLGDIQLGYAHWLLLLAVLAAVARPGRFNDGLRDPAWLAASGLSALAAVLLILTLPIPGITGWLWLHVPFELLQLTTIWPMERLYLVATALVVFAAGSVPWAFFIAPRWRETLRIVVAIGAAWTLWEALPFIRRGLHSRRTEDDTRRSHLSSNLDLTVTAYAFLNLPETFVNGVMDPEFECRIIQGSKEIASPMATALRTAHPVEEGVLRLDGEPGYDGGLYAPKITLQPHRRYLLTLDFLIPPQAALLELIGPTLRRRYILPDSGGPQAFGMEPGHDRSIPVWTDMDRPEALTVALSGADFATHGAQLGALARFALREIPEDRLPVRVLSLLPLRCIANASDDGCELETCRRFIDGYTATVDGEPAPVSRSPDGSVMVPIPKGQSLVELSYRGSWYLRAAFWLTAAGWFIYLAALVRIRPPVIAACVLVAIALLGTRTLLQNRRAAAQIHLRLGAGEALRLGVPVSGLPIGGMEPLFSVGAGGADGLLYARRLDPDRLRIGFRSGSGKVAESEQLAASSNAILSLSCMLGRERTESADYTPSILAGALPILGPAPDRLVPPDRPLSFEAKAGLHPVASAAGDSREAFGPVALFVLFPRDRTGASEPLVVSGLPGAGDFVYATYADDRHVRFGVDHWSVGGAGSPPVAVDYTVPHIIVVRMGALYPEAESPAWGSAPAAVRLRGKSGVTVLLDNRVVLQAPLTAYPSAPGAVTIGRNRIGGSTCGPQFTGRLFRAYRLGLKRTDIEPPEKAE